MTRISSCYKNLVKIYTKTVKKSVGWLWFLDEKNVLKKIEKRFHAMCVYI